MKEDVQIDPRKEEDNVMFYLQSPKEKLTVNENSESYRFINHLISKMINDYEQAPQKIGFIGSADTMIYSLTLLLDEFEGYLQSEFLADLISCDWQRDFENAKREPEESPDAV
jgi:hypothetical protein